MIYLDISHFQGEIEKSTANINAYRFNIAAIDSNIFHIKYKIRGGALQLNFELPQLKCLAKRRTLQLKLSPRTFIKITFPTAVTYDTHMETVIHSDNISTHIHTYIAIISSSTLSALLTYFSLQSCRLILSRCHLSLHPLLLQPACGCYSNANVLKCP